MNTTSITASRTANWTRMVPVMLCFFAMGFVDLVGTASNYVQRDLSLSDSLANLMPSLVFVWFLIFSVPTSLLMNRIGRKNTVLLSLAITLVSLLMPMVGSSFAVMLTAFSLLGIGNAIMQTSLNPLVSCLISPSRLASTLTFGQFVKAIASFLAPVIAAWGAVTAAPTLGLGWKVLFPIYAAVCLLSMGLLGVTPIDDDSQESPAQRRSSVFASIAGCLKLLGRGVVLMCALGIVCHVGIDVGTNTTAPRLMMERLGVTLDEAAIATSIYFVCRTAGCLVGSIALQQISARTFFGISIITMLAGMGLMLTADTTMMLYIAIGMVGVGNSNVFSVIFAHALRHTASSEHNEVSGLMIMGLIGGAIFPLIMGLASDIIGLQNAAVAVMMVGAVYLLLITPRMK